MAGYIPGIMSGAIFGCNPWKKDPVVPRAGLVRHYWRAAGHTGLGNAQDRFLF